MRSIFAVAFRLTLVTLLLTGVVYPLFSTGVASVLFGRQAEGSLLRNGQGEPVGSELLDELEGGGVVLAGRHAGRLAT